MTGWGTLTSVVLGAVIIGYAIHRKMQLEPRGLLVSPKTKAPVKHEDSELVQAKSAIPANPVRDVGVDEAIAFLCFHDWGKRFLDAAGSGKFGSEYDMFLQAWLGTDLGKTRKLGCASTDTARLLVSKSN
jgi:hypothetical protein